MSPFDRVLVIDWSGAGQEDAPVDIRVAEWLRAQNSTRIVPPPVPSTKRWSRSVLEASLKEALRSPHRTLIACDFAFGLPWRSDVVLFECQGWREMIRKLAERYDREKTARATAMSLNQEINPGPFRFDNSRNDYRFYLQHGIGYYRLAENAVAQAISPWYLGSGGTVGFHTITGLAMLHRLLTWRDAELTAQSFEVWPHETWVPKSRGHVIAECYPAMARVFGDERDRDPHTRDVLQVLRWLLSLGTGEWNELFTIPVLPFGRHTDVTFEEQVQFEGWILGLK